MRAKNCWILVAITSLYALNLATVSISWITILRVVDKAGEPLADVFMFLLHGQPWASLLNNICVLLLSVIADGLIVSIPDQSHLHASIKYTDLAVLQSMGGFISRDRRTPGACPRRSW